MALTILAAAAVLATVVVVAGAAAGSVVLAAGRAQDAADAAALAAAHARGAAPRTAAAAAAAAHGGTLRSCACAAAVVTVTVTVPVAARPARLVGITSRSATASGRLLSAPEADTGVIVAAVGWPVERSGLVVTARLDVRSPHDRGGWRNPQPTWSLEHAARLAHSTTRRR